MEGTHLESPSNLSWIINKILEEKSDYISIICAENKVFKCSGLLLAAVSPFISNLMKRSIQNFDECILYLPDINIAAIQGIFQTIDDFASTQITSDNIDWNIDPIENLFYKKIKREVYSKLVKEENDPIYFETIYCKNDFDEIDLTSQSVKIEYETSEDEQLDSKKSIFIRDCKVDIQQLTNVKDPKKKAKQTIRKKGNKNVKEINKNDSDLIFNLLDENKKDDMLEETKTKIKNPRKRKAKVNESLQEDSDIEYDIDNADPNYSESESDAEKNKEKKGKKNPARKRKGRSEKRIKLEDLPKDEKVLNSNELMKNLLEDETNLTNPVPYIYQINGLTVYDALPATLMICPLCMFQFNAVKVFAQHIQRHKLRTFKCQCIPNTNNQEVKEDHIKEILYNKNHWNWVCCETCKKLIDPEKYDRHQAVKHNNMLKHVKCDYCEETFLTKNTSSYKIHMAYHKAESFTCDCPILFDSKKMKVHHMHSVHLKELICCTQCLFVCISRKKLEHHVKKEHLDLSKKPSLATTVCELCGATVKNHHMKEHMLRVHDNVMKQCPYCPKQMSAHNLRTHIRKCHESGGVCNICGAQVGDLVRHNKSVHTPKHLLKYPCKHCDKAFMYSNDIKKHMMSAHLKERPYKCRYGCEFAYNDNSNRNQHEKKKHGQLFTAAKNMISEVKDE